MTSAPVNTTVWTETSVVETASTMLMTERQKPERVVEFLQEMAIRLPQS